MRMQRVKVVDTIVMPKLLHIRFMPYSSVQDEDEDEDEDEKKNNNNPGLVTCPALLAQEIHFPKGINHSAPVTPSSRSISMSGPSPSPVNQSIPWKKTEIDTP